MKADNRIALIAAAYNAAGLACLSLMYVAYRWLIPASPDLFSLAVSLLGAGFGFFISQGSAVRDRERLDRILGAALIREKEVEAKNADEARHLYERELANLKEIIEREGNLLLLRRMREVQLEDAREKLREIDAISIELEHAEKQKPPKEVEQVRERLRGILTNVSNPEEDDRLIRQLTYSIPLVGNFAYVAYMLAKKVDPTLQDRVHRRLNALSGGVGSPRPLLRLGVLLTALVFLVGLFSVVVWVVERGFLR